MKNEEGGGILEGIFNFFLPQHCLICGSYLSRSRGFPLCSCFSRIEYLRSPLCVKCGRPLPGSSALCVTTVELFLSILIVPGQWRFTLLLFENAFTLLNIKDLLLFALFL